MKCLDQTHGDDWSIYNGDCVELIEGLEPASIGLTVHSPPFANLYIYSDSERDMGNCENQQQFIDHYKFLIQGLYRATIPGRLCVIHCKDLPKYANRDGLPGLIDFPSACRQAFEDCGWSYHSRVTIWKCPVTERERTNNVGLLHKTITRDRSQVRQGMADFLIVMRKPPLAEDGLMSASPVTRDGEYAHTGVDGLARYIGSDDPRYKDWHPSPYARKSNSETKQSIRLWQRYAEPVWWDLKGATEMQIKALEILTNNGMATEAALSVLGLSDTDAVWFDVDQMDVLNYKAGRGKEDERHICPLQLDLIGRCIQLWSNDGDIVLDPFNGIGSTTSTAVKLGRRAIGFELKPEYYQRSLREMEIVEETRRQRSLFALDT